MVSIIIPTKNEVYLERTIQDLLDKCCGEIEIIVILDGYNPPERNSDPRVKYLYFEESIGMKDAINHGVAHSKGEYLLKIDAHCIIDNEFDRKLIRDHQFNWVQIPRRHKLDEEKWLKKDDYVDYEYWIYPLKYNPPGLHGFKWLDRTAERKDILIDDTLTFQGSCWFMTKEWFKKCNFLNVEGYGTLPAQEATYIGNTTWLNGGRVVTNKNTWYAHLHKTQKRGYSMSKELQNQCYIFSYNYWLNDNKEGFIKLIEKFWPLPNWPNNWQNRLWTH